MAEKKINRCGFRSASMMRIGGGFMVHAQGILFSEQFSVVAEEVRMVKGFSDN